MDCTRRQWLLGTAALLTTTASTATVRAEDKILLADTTSPGDHYRYDIVLKVDGKMKVDRAGQAEMLPLRAAGRHQFVERIEVGTNTTAAGKAIRVYSDAQSESIVSVDRSRRVLGNDRRMIVVQKTAEGMLHFSPGGPLTRDELDLVSEQFDTLCLPGLLPEKEVKVGDTWPIRDDIAQAACLFDGVTKNELVGKLVEIKGGKAIFSIAGKADGVEEGAIVKLTISAMGQFDIASKRIVGITWEQNDDRSQGPVSPAVEVKAAVTVTRAFLAEAPKELSETERAKLPKEGKVADLLTQLHHAHPKGAYEFIYPRDWHIVVNTDAHLIMRLLQRGEFVAQATLSGWKPSMGDRAAVVKDFIDATSKQPGWQPDKVLENGPVSSSADRQVYRLVITGKQDELAVVQSFYLLTNNDGRQLILTCLAKTEQAAQIGTRDVALVNAIEFTGKK